MIQQILVLPESLVYQSKLIITSTGLLDLIEIVSSSPQPTPPTIQHANTLYLSLIYHTMMIFTQ